MPPPPPPRTRFWQTGARALPSNAAAAARQGGRRALAKVTGCPFLTICPHRSPPPHVDRPCAVILLPPPPALPWRCAGIGSYRLLGCPFCGSPAKESRLAVAAVRRKDRFPVSNWIPQLKRTRLTGGNFQRGQRRLLHLADSSPGFCSAARGFASFLWDGTRTPFTPRRPLPELLLIISATAQKQDSSAKSRPFPSGSAS